jgi:hypothetical protein
MPDDSKQPALNIGGNTVVIALLAAAGAYFVAHQTPLQDSRPPATEASISERVGEQDTDARLWQDPFTAVANALTKSPELNPDNCNDKLKKHCESPLNAPAPALSPNVPAPTPSHTSASAPPLVIVVSVSAAPYAEDREFRRRTRYAVLAGLNEEGYEPEDPQHIGFFWPRISPGLQLPTVVPFEWLKPSHKADMLSQRVLLVWFSEDVLTATSASASPPTPLKHLAHFLCSSLLPNDLWDAIPTTVKILGPQSSTTLRAMVNELDIAPEAWSSGGCPASPPFYVYSATTDDATLIASDPSDPACFKRNSCLTEFFAKHPRNIKLYRTISTDQALAKAMRDELRLRRIEQDGGSLIALLSEWDTVYGRAVPESVRRCFGRVGDCQSGDTSTPWLRSFKYLRGLDGHMPDAKGRASGSSKDEGKKPASGDEDQKSAQSDWKARDRAEGQAQFDYLRRLGDRLQEWERDRRSEHPKGKGIEAIGVLGSDAHDKLLILQALRPLFPNAWFFTTDLDALLLHPVDSTPTRNLLVASGFGLKLRSELQGEVPPFRSSYQTAAFLATRLAIRASGPPPASWVTPLVFEIGSSQTFQFANRPPNGTEVSTSGSKQAHEDCGSNLLSCDAIQPAASMKAPEMTHPLAIAFSVAGICLLLSFRLPRRWTLAGLDTFMKGSSGYPDMFARLALVLAGLVLVVYAVSWAILRLWQHGPWLADDGQPLILLDGISIWPTILLRGATFFLCIWFIADSRWRLDDNIKKIAKDLDLTQTREQAETGRYEFLPKTAWGRFASYFWYREDQDTLGGSNDRSSQNVLRFWRMYVHQGQLKARLLRVGAGFAALLLLWYLLGSIFEQPHPPTRGDASFQAYRYVTFASFGAMWFLIFFVADTTLLSWNIVRAFRTKAAAWPASTLQKIKAKLRLPDEVLDDWIGLIFVAKRTKCITRMIYWPFVVIALLVLSRSPLLANFAASLPDLVVTGLAVAIVLACAAGLRWSAETSRDRARRRLKDQIVIAKTLKDGEGQAEQLQILSSRVEELRDGAFSPFSQQPAVRAILLPLSTYGVTALLQYLLVPGLS